MYEYVSTHAYINNLFGCTNDGEEHCWKYYKISTYKIHYNTSLKQN
jgi:hypothetical protein